MTIQSIIKKAIKRLELEGKLLTPDFYAEAFCKEAAKAGMTTDDCTHVERLKVTLNKDLQEELKQYRISTMLELSRFLISKLNRTNPGHCAKMLDEQTQFTHEILEVVKLLHNKEASELAVKSLDLLNSSPNPSQLEQYKQSWTNFLTTYDDTFLQTLDGLTELDTKDLKKSIENMQAQSSVLVSQSTTNLNKISALLISSLVPSIASKIDEKIVSVGEKIKNNPELLETPDIASEVRTAISLRIALDKKRVKKMIGVLSSVLDKLSLRLIELIERSDNSTEEIQKIKRDLEKLTEKETSDFKIAHKKLYTIATVLEENTQLLSKDLKTQNNEVGALAQKISELEEELASARQKSQEDFLTKLYNRRALDEFLEMKEAEYKRYGHDFTVVLLDIDHFKSINDTYGHDAGDAVLSSFANILKQEARAEDIVGRFGGEEFMAVLTQTDVKGGFAFAEKVRKHIERAKFMYKGERIAVTVSAGVSERAKNDSIQSVLKSADGFLYQAKHNGRNQVAYKK